MIYYRIRSSIALTALLFATTFMALPSSALDKTCECVNISSTFGTSSSKGGQMPGPVELAYEGVTTESGTQRKIVALGQWFKVSASAYDCDAVVGSGSRCSSGSVCSPTQTLCGSTPITCSTGLDKAHDETNEDVPFAWGVGGAENTHLPIFDEEEDHPGCPRYDYGVDPYVWIQAPLEPGPITITCSRAASSGHPDGSHASASATVYAETAPSPIPRLFAASSDSLAQAVQGAVDDANVLLRSDDDNYPTVVHLSDVNGDGKIDCSELGGQDARGHFDVPINREYTISAPSSGPTWSSDSRILRWQSAWTSEPVLLADAQGHVTSETPQFCHSSWFIVGPGGDSFPSGYDVLFVSEIYQVIDEGTYAYPVIKPAPGSGFSPDTDCRASSTYNRTVTKPIGSTLLHEFGHNAGLAHVDPAEAPAGNPQARDGLVKNLMSAGLLNNNDNGWIAGVGVPLYEDAASCGQDPNGSQLQVNYFTAEH